MSHDLMAYFGYGSLVNLNTLQTNYVAAYPATLKGWRRHWQSFDSKGADRALLSVHEYASYEISGMLVIDRYENLPALDARETHYQRVPVSADALSIEDNRFNLSNFKADQLFVYVADHFDDTKPPLLQSYLDAVMSGFYEHYGSTGLQAFLSTTIGFDRKIIVDRDNPKYPRAVNVDPDMAKWFDKLLKKSGVQFE